jgi:hypothetical protein
MKRSGAGVYFFPCLENNMTTKDISTEQLGQISVYDEHSTATQLVELWQEQAAVIVFIRHFG